MTPTYRRNRLTEDLLCEMRARDLAPPRPDWPKIMVWTLAVGFSLTCWFLVIWWIV